MATLVTRRHVFRDLVLLSPLVLAALGAGLLLVSKDVETMRAIVILSVLALFSFVLFRRIAWTEPQGSPLLWILWASFAAKLGAMAYRFYGGVLADAFVYNSRGRLIAEQLARGEWPEGVGAFGTQFLRLATGVVYYVIGVTFYGITILWTWLGLIGMLFFYLAFRTAFPQGDRRLYMLLVFLFPSMLLWTSSLGKDAPMIMFLGMAAYGAAVLQQRVSVAGLWWASLGMAGTFMIRPHVSVLFLVAFASTVLIRPIRAGLMSPVIRFGGILAMIAVIVALLGSASEYAGLDEVGTEEVFQFISEYQEFSARGGSAFEQVDPGTPLGLALAVPTVLFRPFPWEAHNTHAAIASIEGMALLALMLRRRRSVAAALRSTLRNSYVMLLVVYIALFIFFFSAIGNFGIMVRQRASQLFPFVLMLVAYLGSRSEGVPDQRSESRESR